MEQANSSLIDLGTEQRRLKQVWRVQRSLSTQASEELQSIVRLATNFLEMPIGLVSIVGEDRQDFAANVGLEGTDSTPRVVSFCSHAVEANANLIVSDTQADERFVKNALVTGAPHIRAYAGSPIMIEGQPIGTVCAIDRQPRTFTESEVAFLEELASLTSTILMGRRWSDDAQKHLKRLEDQKRSLWKKAHFDGLTGLANREYFTEQFEQALDTRPEETALVILDVDGFKAINDQHGHYVGDQCLIDIAKAMKSVARSADFAGRLGGDEFGYLVQGKRPDEAAQKIFHRLQQRLATYQPARGFALALSAGSATALSTDGSFDALYKAADTALYAAKDAGKNQIIAYDGQKVSHTSPRQSFRKEFLSAIKHDEIVPFYQPKVSLFDGSISGFEVLARRERPDGSVQTPVHFEKAFQDVTLARRLAEHMIRQMVRDYRDIAPHVASSLRFGVNVTAHELGDPHFTDLVIDLLGSADMPCDQLTLEVTENVMLGSDQSQAFKSLHTLREAGVQIAFDDFGTGYGALQHLASWPIDRVKFDRILIEKALRDERAMIVLSSMINTCRRLGFVVVIEGIESEHQAYLFSELGAEVGQGYYFAKPFPRDDLKEFLDNFEPTIFRSQHQRATNCAA